MVIVIRQTVDLFDVKNAVGFQEGYFPVDLATLAIVFRLGEPAGEDDGRAAFTFADGCIQLQGLFESHPYRRGKSSSHTFRPHKQNVYTRVWLSVMTKWPCYPPGRIAGAPRLYPRTHAFSSSAMIRSVIRVYRSALAPCSFLLIFLTSIQEAAPAAAPSRRDECRRCQGQAAPERPQRSAGRRSRCGIPPAPAGPTARTGRSGRWRSELHNAEKPAGGERVSPSKSGQLFSPERLSDCAPPGPLALPFCDFRCSRISVTRICAAILSSGLT